MCTSTTLARRDAGKDPEVWRARTLWRTVATHRRFGVRYWIAAASSVLIAACAVAIAAVFAASVDVGYCCSQAVRPARMNSLKAAFRLAYFMSPTVVAEPWAVAVVKI
jgi:hypothetical protein